MSHLDSTPTSPDAAAPAPPAPPSLARVLEQSFTRTGEVLFKHGTFPGWLTLGFAAFIAFLFEGMGFEFQLNATPPVPAPQPGQGPLDYLRDHLGIALPWVLGGGGLLLAMLIALGLVVLWLRCRGRFIFLRGVLTARPAVVEPWRSLGPRGDNLFQFWAVLAIVSGALFALVLIGGVGLGWNDLQQRQFTARGAAALALLIGGGGVVAISYPLAKLLMDELLVPTMYARGVGWREGWRTVHREIVRVHPGPLALYLLVRLGAALVLGVLEGAMVCMTCCLAAVPYVGSVILLPLIVFRRVLAITFLEQLGPGWAMFDLPRPALRCPRCGYDLRGNPGASSCPECGILLTRPSPDGGGAVK